jgi:hypothetical protein
LRHRKNEQAANDDEGDERDMRQHDERSQHMRGGGAHRPIVSESSGG